MKNKKWKRCRAKLGLSQSEVARRIGCTRSHFANMENGYRKPTGYQRLIANVLKLKGAL